MNYQEIIDAATLYADRQDLEVTNSVGVFISMAEARMNRKLKTREQSYRAYTPTVEGDEYYSLPPDYRGMRDIQLNSDLPDLEHTNTSFEYLSPQQFNNKRGCPTDNLFYTVIANQIQIYPTQAAGQTIEMVYYQKVPTLSASAPTNWMSEEHPDIYLAGITAEIETFVKNYDVAKGWDDRMTRAINELEQSDVEERWSGTPLVMKIG